MAGVMSGMSLQQLTELLLFSKDCRKIAIKAVFDKNPDKKQIADILSLIGKENTEVLQDFLKAVAEKGKTDEVVCDLSARKDAMLADAIMKINEKGVEKQNMPPEIADEERTVFPAGKIF